MKEKGKILVIGGGISGITTAIEASEVGRDVILVEKSPTLGGRVSGFHQYFPKLCPPTCGLEINYRRLRANPRMFKFTPTLKSFRFPEKQGISKSKSGKTQLL